MSHVKAFLVNNAALACTVALVASTIGAFRANAQDGTVTYEATVDITWSAASAPYEFPDGAHLSGIVGATHNESYVLFRDGQTGSSGLELVAENGRPKTLEAEFAEGMRRGQINAIVYGPGFKEVPAAKDISFSTTPEHPLFSFVTMIAPSPDWFTGISDFQLFQDGAWIEEAELTLWAWDSGTDFGPTYTSPNDDSQPQESVRLLATPHFLTEDGLVPMGTITLRRIDG